MWSWPGNTTDTALIRQAKADLREWTLARWARALIEAGGDNIPQYGSPEWAALDDRDPRKPAACVMDAERWRTRHHDVDFLGITSSRRARDIAEARRPRPGDHQGGPVRWDREQAVSNGC